MSGSMGHTFLYNIIIIFILVVFGFLAGTMSYYKAFKINNRIISAIEKYEGYNTASGAVQEINSILQELGYSRDIASCKSKYHNMSLYSNGSQYEYCVYVNDTRKNMRSYTFGVMTFMTIDFPLINRIKIPVFSKTRSIYNFSR